MKDLKRQEEIVRFLYNSELARQHRDGSGFFVASGPSVEFQDGTVKDVCAWMIEEGFHNGTQILNMNVVYQQPGSPYGERFTFFTIPVVAVPFSSPAKDQVAVTVSKA